jgi:hypothetical protein
VNRNGALDAGLSIRRVRLITVLVYAAIFAAAGDVITTYQAQSVGRGEATRWLANLFERYPIGVGLVALFGLRAALVGMGAMSTNSRAYVWRVLGFAWLVDLVLAGCFVVAHNVVVA